MEAFKKESPIVVPFSLVKAPKGWGPLARSRLTRTLSWVVSLLNWLIRNSLVGRPHLAAGDP